MRKKQVYCNDRRGLLLVGMLMLSGIGSTVYAQDTPIPAQVTYLTGNNVYLDAGQDRGVQAGDTLIVFREGVRLGEVAVVSSTSTRSVVTFAAAPFPVTVGIRLQLQLPTAPSAARLSEDELPPTSVRPVQAAPRPRTKPSPDRRAAASGPQVTGRLLLSLNTLQSTTSWNVGEAGTNKRTFVTPSLNLHTTISDLPHGVRLRTRLRADYRFTSGRSIDPQVSLRAYEVLMEKDFTRFTVQAGRFSNRYAPFGGYWDGALVHVGSQKNGFGTALGFMPDRGNEGFSAEMPRFAGFAHVEVGERSGPRYAAEVSFNEIRPTNDLLNHRFAGLSHSLRWGGGFTLRNDVQLDRNPETNQWMASRFVVRSSVALHRRLRIHGRYTMRQPYSIWRVQRVISYRRDQANAGFSLQLPRATVGGDVAFNFIDLGDGESRSDGRSVSAYLQVPKTGVLGTGFSAIGSYWSDERGSSTFFNTGVTRALGRARTRLHYQFYRTVTLTEPLRTHAVSVQAVVPLGRRLSTRSQIRLQRSASLRSIAFFTSLWYSF